MLGIIIEGKYDASGGPAACWPWTGWIGSGGYGVAQDSRHRLTTSAHRAVYTCLAGAIPEGMDLDHLCRNRRCVNSLHLEPVTRSENLRRGNRIAPRVPSEEAKKVWTRNLQSEPRPDGLCKRGHPLNGVRTRGKGGRYCKECISINRQQRLTGVTQG